MTPEKSSHEQILRDLESYLGQITQLSTWSVLLGVGLLHNLFRGSAHAGLVLWAITSFFLAILSALLARIARLQRAGDGTWLETLGFFSCWLAFLSFCGGLALLLLFAWSHSRV